MLDMTLLGMYIWHVTAEFVHFLRTARRHCSIGLSAEKRLCVGNRRLLYAQRHSRVIPPYVASSVLGKYRGREHYLDTGVEI